MQEPHRLSAENVLKNYKTSPQQGLSTSEATRLLSVYGPNELIERKHRDGEKRHSGAWFGLSVDGCRWAGPTGALRAGSGLSGYGLHARSGASRSD